MISDLLLLKIYGPEQHMLEHYTQVLKEGKDYEFSEDQDYFEESKTDESFLDSCATKKDKRFTEVRNSKEYKEAEGAEAKLALMEKIEEEFTSFYEPIEYSLLYATGTEDGHNYPFYMVLLENTKALGLELTYELHKNDGTTKAQLKNFKDYVEFKPPLNRRYDLREIAKGESPGEDILYEFIDTNKSCLQLKMKIVAGPTCRPVYAAVFIVVEENVEVGENGNPHLLVIEKVNELSKQGISSLVNRNLTKKLLRPLELHRGPASKRSKSGKGVGKGARKRKIKEENAKSKWGNNFGNVKSRTAGTIAP